MQVYLLHAYDVNDNMVPCGYVLLQRKDKATYIQMLTEFKKIADGIQVVLNPKVLLADFESSVHAAFRFIWPEIIIKGCFFHFRQANSRWIFAHGYKCQYMNNPAFKSWCRKIGALALIPEDQVEGAWSMIKGTPVGLDVQPIINYFERTWMRGHFQPSMWNHYGTYGPRTNNHVESFNALINKQLNSPHPNMWKFINFIKTQDNKMTLWSLQQKQMIYTKKKATREQMLITENEKKVAN